MNQKKNPKWKLSLLLLMLVPVSLLSQTTQIKGSITDAATGAALPGVTVIVKGTTVGAVTDFEGNYTIMIPPDATLAFSYVGYSPEEVAVG